jgi:predicted 3-demethylubiquinone-9 3-methyltransferase (glyoxalase superfamily)
VLIPDASATSATDRGSILAHSITPFLMFEGKAEEAMNAYIALFPRSEIVKVDRYRRGEPGTEGSVKLAEFKIVGQSIFCNDSPVKHAFGFTPSISLFVECESESEFDSAFSQLSMNGRVLMEPGNYGFSLKFGWLDDRFGVSWQLNLSS